MTTTSRWFLWICFVTAAPAFANNELWSVVQGIAPGTQIEVQVKGAKHRGTLGTVTAAGLSINTAAAQLSLAQTEIRKVRVRKSKFRRRTIVGGIIGAASGAAISIPFVLSNEGPDHASIIATGSLAGFGIGAGVGALTARAHGYYTVYDSANRP